MIQTRRETFSGTIINTDSHVFDREARYTEWGMHPFAFSTPLVHVS